MRREMRAPRLPSLAGDEEDSPETSALEAELEIDLDNLRACAASHPDLQYRAALVRARLESKARVADMERASAEQKILSYLRDQQRDRPVPQTEDQLLTRARQHADVDKAERRAAELRRQLDLARALAEAYDVRGRLLIALAGVRD